VSPKAAGALCLFSLACATPVAGPPASATRALDQNRPVEIALCQRMASWNCLELDCSACGVAEEQRHCEAVPMIAAVGALLLASAAGGIEEHGAPPTFPFAGALHASTPPGPHAHSQALEDCQETCRRCADAAARCAVRPAGTAPGSR
jgi:hypothetical protein